MARLEALLRADLVAIVLTSLHGYTTALKHGLGVSDPRHTLKVKTNPRLIAIKLGVPDMS